MTPISSSIFFFFFFSLFFFASVSPARAEVEDRAPHGLANQNPVSISPSAYDFFHPNANAAHQPASTTNDVDDDRLCSSRSSKCSSFPLTSAAAQVRATQVHQPTLPAATPDSSTRVGAGGIAGIVVGLAFALLLAMGAYYVVVTRRSNSHKLNSPDV